MSCIRLFCLMALWLPLNLFASTPVNKIFVFGDSLSDTGNTHHLLKTLRMEEDPAYLVQPLKVFVINKMKDFADSHYVPEKVLRAGIKTVTLFFDRELAPMLATLIDSVRKVPVLPGEPYWQARFSNGPVWNEYLAPMLTISDQDEEQFGNKAFGGSWAVTYDHQLTVWNLIRHPLLTLKSLIVGKLIPPSLGLTVQAYLMEHQSLDADTVYFIFSGNNDYVNALRFDEQYNPATMSVYTDNVINNLSTSLNKLVRAGAKHLVVMGLPYVGNAPKFNRTMDREVLNAAIEQYNQRVKALISEWEQQKTVDFMYIDIQALFSMALNHPERYGFTNTTDACIDVKLPTFDYLKSNPFTYNYVLQYAEALQYRDSQFAEGEKNYQLCEGQDGYLFWDELHPSTRAHRYLAVEICKAMEAHGYRVNCQLTNNPVLGIAE